VNFLYIDLRVLKNVVLVSFKLAFLLMVEKLFGHQVFYRYDRISVVIHPFYEPSHVYSFGIAGNHKVFSLQFVGYAGLSYWKK
jgi:hypothetical protein